MSAHYFQLGIQLSAVALILGGLVLLLLGRVDALGASFRSSLEPLLGEVRARTTKSRVELADATLNVAIALAVAAALFDREPIAMVIAVSLYLFRPALHRLTSDENPMTARINTVSIDLVIGLYVPIVLAQVLLLNLFLGASLLSAIVALSWPAGGGAVPGRRWRLATIS